MVVTPGSRIISADAYDDLLKEKCGYLEEQQEEEFFAFMNQQLGRRLSGRTPPTKEDKELAEIFFIIQLEMTVNHTRGGARRMLVEAYKSAVLKRHK